MADRRLQVFHTVARLLSFTKAAETLHMTQPAVTFQIRQLEEYFNTRLFDRTHNRISLTAAGERVYEYADRIVALYAEMENRVRELTGDVSGILIIGASTTIAEYVLPQLLGEFKERYPNINIRLRVSNSLGIVHMVEDNSVDVGIVESPITNKNLAVEVCWHDKLVFISLPNHPLAKKASICAKDLDGQPFVCREEGSGTREFIQDYLATAGVQLHDLNVSVEVGNPEAVKSAVEAGLGVSIVSQATVIKELKLGTVVARPLDPPLERPFSIVFQRQKFRLRAMEEFMDFAREHCEKQASTDKP
ncbi:LysR family transcriptional regulator [Sulfurifustis variabilis]|uniref:LysR family transcriptional regulator n=1 Tax=Sulfurifustis variabilis TaxID=1675686 RepID=A0A1B4VBC3_9GAMM|nr:selenium metabolism-associated LysR family transcriptional regulator [Sulfurifustis variabilis]BAU49534.1 LysR family transcriptional regulator [Sulfurifustis variabilis]